MEGLSRRYAIRLHRAMWKDMARETVLSGSVNRHTFKRHWIRDIYGQKSCIENDCFLCEYAISQYLKVKGIEDTPEHRNDIPCMNVACKYCPLKWSIDETDLYADEDVDIPFCEAKDVLIDAIDWRYSDCKTIANLPEREDNKIGKKQYEERDEAN